MRSNFAELLANLGPPNNQGSLTFVKSGVWNNTGIIGLGNDGKGAACAGSGTLAINGGLVSSSTVTVNTHGNVGLQLNGGVLSVPV